LVFLADCFLLGWIGQNVVEYPFIELGQALSIFYFLYLIVLLPVLSRLEYNWCVEAIQNDYQNA